MAREGERGCARKRNREVPWAGTPGSGAEQVVVCSVDSCLCASECQRLLCSRCRLVSRWVLTPHAQQLAQAVAGPGLHKRAASQPTEVRAAGVRLNWPLWAPAASLRLCHSGQEKGPAARFPGEVWWKGTFLDAVIDRTSASFFLQETDISCCAVVVLSCGVHRFYSSSLRAEQRSVE